MTLGGKGLSNVLNDRSHPANVIGNVGNIRSDLRAVGKNSSHDTRTLKMNPTLPERVYRRLVYMPNLRVLIIF